MQSDQLLLKNDARRFSPFVIVLATLMCLSACKGKKATTTSEELKVTADISCLTLTSGQLGTWFPKYGRPTNPEKDKITVIKFYVTSIPGSDAIEVKVRGFNSTNTAITSSITLGTGLVCATVLPPFLIGQSFDVKLSDWNIVDPTTGNLVNNFSRVVMRPGVYKDGGMGPDLLKFNADIYIGDAPAVERLVLPCPPCYNCKPMPEGCVKQDSTIIDQPALRDSAGGI